MAVNPSAAAEAKSEGIKTDMPAAAEVLTAVSVLPDKTAGSPLMVHPVLVPEEVSPLTTPDTCDVNSRIEPATRPDDQPERVPL